MRFLSSMLVMLLVSGNVFAKSDKTGESIQFRVTSRLLIKDFTLKVEGDDVYSYEKENGEKYFITKREIIDGMVKHAEILKKPVNRLVMMSVGLLPVTLIGIYTLSNPVFFSSFFVSSHVTMGLYSGVFATLYSFYKKKIKSFKSGGNVHIIVMDKDVLKSINSDFHNQLFSK